MPTHHNKTLNLWSSLGLFVLLFGWSAIAAGDKSEAQTNPVDELIAMSGSLPMAGAGEVVVEIHDVKWKGSTMTIELVAVGPAFYANSALTLAYIDMSDFAKSKHFSGAAYGCNGGAPIPMSEFLLLPKPAPRPGQEETHHRYMPTVRTLARTKDEDGSVINTLALRFSIGYAAEYADATHVVIGPSASQINELSENLAKRRHRAGLEELNLRFPSRLVSGPNSTPKPSDSP